MLTRVWNKDNPDRVVAALLTYLNNLRIDGAKTGIVHEYSNYPIIARRIGKASGGKNGRMPYFFQFSKNARKDDIPSNRCKKYAESNKSTMNRICHMFDDIGNINMNYAGIDQFNWQMLLAEPCPEFDSKIVQLFCDLDNSKIPNVIESQESSYSSEKQLINRSNIVEEDIVNQITQQYGSLEVAYPHITKYLFAGDGMNKSAHKQTFWRVFGQIALNNLRNNLSNSDKCETCRMQIPSWVENHKCVKNVKGFYECIVCGKICERKHSNQCRCEKCQAEYKSIYKRMLQKKKRRELQDAENKRITRFASSLNET